MTCVFKNMKNTTDILNHLVSLSLTIHIPLTYSEISHA